MTIRRSTIVSYPFLGEKSVSYEARRAHSEYLWYSVPDEFGNGKLEGWKRVIVLSPEMAVEKVLTQRYVTKSQEHTIVGLLDFPKPEHILIGNDLNQITNSEQGGQTRGIFGERVVYEYEPTLPPQARK